MKLLLGAAAALALSACEKPCALGCADSSECLQSQYCFQRIACLPKCISCGGVCVTTLHDNCGTCGLACAAAEVCEAGKCRASCSSGTPCNGACTDPGKDAFNCGTCGKACGEGEICASGTCTRLNSCS